MMESPSTQQPKSIRGSCMFFRKDHAPPPTLSWLKLSRLLWMLWLWSVPPSAYSLSRQVQTWPADRTSIMLAGNCSHFPALGSKASTVRSLEPRGRPGDEHVAAAAGLLRDGNARAA